VRLESRFLTLLIGCALCTPSQAQSLANAGFDTDLAAWSNPFDRPVAWDPLDATGDPDSGSARVSHPLPGNGGIALALGQCMPVLANQRYRVGAWAQLVAEPPPNVTGELIVRMHATADCSDVAFTAYDVAYTIGTTWERIQGVVPPTALAGSLQVWLGVGKPTGVDETISARFDDVFVIPLPLFVNGFESP
jgi:hypothetical protein